MPSSRLGFLGSVLVLVLAAGSSGCLGSPPRGTLDAEGMAEPASNANAEPSTPGAHTLVVGGTGMLRRVAMTLAGRGHPTTVIARRPGPLARMAEESGGGIHPLAVDYGDGEALEAGLRRAIEARGPFTLLVAWIHDSAPEAPAAVARIAAEGGGRLRYLHVLGSAADDPSQPDPERRARMEAIEGVTYEEVILGFVREGGRSRWLTDDEIAAGVLAAIDNAAPRRIVGNTRPWSARP